jgi:WD40 repeat protein
VLSPDGRWIDPRDSGWADTVPTGIAERMGLAELHRSPRGVHAHRDHEVAVAGPGMLAIVDGARRLCRSFALGADSLHAAADPPRVIDDVRFLEDGHLVTAGLSTVRRWDVRALCEAASVQHGALLPTAIVLAADGHAVRGGVLVTDAEPRPETRAGRALCAGAHRVALAIEDPSTKQVRAIAVSDLATRARVVELPAADVALAALGEGDRWLAFASGNQVTVVDLDTERSHSRALGNLPTALAFYEGRWCVIGDAGGRVQSFDRLGAFAAHDDAVQVSAAPVTALAATGLRLAIATADGRIHTWAPGDPAPAQLAILPATTSRLAFSPDGALLAAASDDDIVRVFDLASRSLVARLYHLEAGWAAVRADGKYDYGGDVSRLSCVSELRTYRLRDLDELLPGSRLPRPR